MVKKTSISVATNILILCFGLGFSEAQIVEEGTIWPSIGDFQVAVSVQVERKGDKYDFTYTVINLPVSKRPITYFHVEHLDPRPRGYTAAQEGISNIRGYVDGIQFDDPGYQGGWNGWNQSNVSKWANGRDPDAGKFDSRSKPSKTAIKPGESESGFKLTNRNGPPRIATFYVTPWIPRPVLHGDSIVIEDRSGLIPVTQVIEKVGEFADSMIQGKLKNQRASERGILGRTLGPAIPPTDVNELCDTYIRSLIIEVRKAAKLGWIKHDLRNDRDGEDGHGERNGNDGGKNRGHEKDDEEGDDGDDSDLNEKTKNLPGVAKSIIKKLTKVRRECLRGRFGNVREELRALIKQVNAQRGKHLTEEAYALIRFNAEFLLEKI